MSSSGSQEVDLTNQEELPSSVQAELAIKVNSDQLAKNNVNVGQEQSEPESRITRVRTLTEKGRAYQEQRQREHEKDEDQLVGKFHEAYDEWKTQATEIESLMAKESPSSQVEREEAILRLKEFRNKAELIYDKIRIERAPGQEIRQKMDGCDALTQTLERKSIAASRNEEDRSSVRSRSSKASTRSRRSRTSRSSKAPSLMDLKKADAAAELAAREVEFNALQEETRHKEATARMEAELAQRKLELEQMEAKKQIEIARAKLKVYQEVEEFQDDMDYVEEDHLQSPPIQINLDPGAASFIPPQEPKYSVPDANTPNSTAQSALQPHDVHQFSVESKTTHPANGQPQASPANVDTVTSIVTAIADSFSLSRLPAPEPTIFSGEPILYPDWKSSFHALIHRKNLPSSDKMYYLKRYVSGSAKEAINGLFLQSSSEAYERAWNILDERFGHPFIVTNAYRDKLRKWPKIGMKDHQGLRRFADFLTSVETAMQVIENLNVLNDYMENQKLLTKLPDWLVSRWNREATRKMKEEKKYPDFKTFTTFISAEADLLCNPISSCYAVKEVERTTDSTRQEPNPKYDGKKSVHNTKTTEESSKEPNSTSKLQPQCSFCKRTDHLLNTCVKFKAETRDNKLNFVKENKLCFGCLRKGHMSSDCKKRLTCATCNKNHPTCLHEKRHPKKLEEKKRREEQEPTNVRKTTSCTSQGASTTSTSMIVPVWLSSLSKPDKEVLVYAILDTQSDATFVLKETCEELNAETQPTKLRLSTITSQDSLVESQRVSSLQVRGYNSDVKIPIPVAFTSTCIPADEEHIPTKEIAKNWEHLRSIENEMHDLFDCNVGLLIGYDCSQALTPREVLAGGNDEPYGIKTDLGWSIVGKSDVRSRRSLCHKVAVRKIPAVTMNDIVRVFESDFQGAKNDKKTSQEDLNFLRIMEEGTEKTENGLYEMPLPFKDHPILPDNHSMALIRLEHLKRKFLKGPRYKEDYVKFMDDVLSRRDVEEAPGPAREEAIKVHLFGATSSPGCAGYGLKYMASQEKEAHSSATQFIVHNFYVEDGLLTSVESAQQAKDLIRGAREICQKGELRLHKFVSNDYQVLESVAKSERAVDVILNLQSEQLPIERVLGVQWSVGLDCFRFSIILKDQPLTRRGVLATVASVYDPLGFLAPLVLRAKTILQEICNKGVNWDEPLPEEVRPRWERWKRDLLHLDELQIPRCFEPKTLNGKKTYELHSFADASTSGYEQCFSPMVKNEDENVYVSLVTGKSRVAPTKITSIPRTIQRITHPETPRREAMPNALLLGDQYRKLFPLWKAWTKESFNVMFWKALKTYVKLFMICYFVFKIIRIIWWECSDSS